MFQGGPDKGVSNIGLKYDVRGWVRTVRHQKIISFIEASQWDDDTCMLHPHLAKQSGRQPCTSSAQQT